jgi:hypothetical protein
MVRHTTADATEVRIAMRRNGNAPLFMPLVSTRSPLFGGLVVCVPGAVAGERGGEAGRACDRVIRCGEAAFVNFTGLTAFDRGAADFNGGPSGN